MTVWGSMRLRGGGGFYRAECDCGWVDYDEDNTYDFAWNHIHWCPLQVNPS
jgi:hypothetical protein